MYNDQDILERINDIICYRYGILTNISFMTLIRRSNNGQLPILKNLSIADQIDIVNTILRTELVKHPNTTDIRSWLCASSDSEAYIDSFQSHLLPLLYETGILD